MPYCTRGLVKAKGASKKNHSNKTSRSSLAQAHPSSCFLGLLLLLAGLGRWWAGILLSLLGFLLWRCLGRFGSFLDRSHSAFLVRLAALVGFRGLRGLDWLGLALCRRGLSSRVAVDLVSSGSQSNLDVGFGDLLRLAIIRNRLTGFVSCGLDTVDGEILLVGCVPNLILSAVCKGERGDLPACHPRA